ncbi:hypothetical protein PHISP_00288 [Aspergillus sp. HF37]|nr:hypothetical protein PHISP_00288 [Aspergillus sp. HF37]
MLSPLSKIFRSSGSAPTEDSPNISSRESVTQPDSKDQFESHNQAATDDVPDETVQDGVAQVEAITLTWTKTSLGIAISCEFELIPWRYND